MAHVTQNVVRDTYNLIDNIIHHPEDLGSVNAYPLNDNQFQVLKSLKSIPSSRTKNDFKILAIQDIMSTYAYGAVNFDHFDDDFWIIPRAPRYKAGGVNSNEVGEHKRFSPQNNLIRRFSI